MCNIIMVCLHMSNELHIAIHFIIWVIVLMGGLASLDKTVKENQIAPFILGLIIIFIPTEITYWSLYFFIYQ